MKPLLIIIIIFGILGCQPERKTTDFGKFQIDLPQYWNIYEVKGIDSYTQLTVTKSQDTIRFDIGYYSNDLNEEILVLIQNSKKESLIQDGLDTSGIIFIDSITNDTYKKYLTQNRREIKIDGFLTYLVTPKEISNGITGVYFDSIGSGVGGNIKFNFYGQDLDEKEQNELLNAIQTIKIKK